MSKDHVLRLTGFYPGKPVSISFIQQINTYNFTESRKFEIPGIHIIKISLMHTCTPEEEEVINRR